MQMSAQTSVDFGTYLDEQVYLTTSDTDKRSSRFFVSVSLVRSLYLSDKCFCIVTMTGYANR